MAKRGTSIYIFEPNGEMPYSQSAISSRADENMRDQDVYKYLYERRLNANCHLNVNLVLQTILASVDDNIISFSILLSYVSPIES